MYVRWLGAFRKSGYSLLESIHYEVSVCGLKESACEKFKSDSKVRAQIGLLCNPSKITKEFNGDCWSEYNRHGSRLHKTRNPKDARSEHLESWILGRDSFTGIVLCKGITEFNTYIQNQVREAHTSTGLPVYRLMQGSKRARLVKIEL